MLISLAANPDVLNVGLADFGMLGSPEMIKNQHLEKHAPYVYAFLLITPMFFSVNVVLGRYMVESFSPWVLATMRWALAACLLLPFLFLHKGTITFALSKKQLGQIFVLGMLGIGVCGGGYYWSLQHTSAVHGALLYSPSPALAVLVEAIILRQWLGFRRLLGLLICFAGVLSVVLHGDFSTLGNLKMNKGDFGVLICALAWAFYSVLLRKSELQSLSGLWVFFLSIIMGLVFMLPMTLFEVATQYSIQITPKALFFIFLLALMPSLLSFLSYQKTLRVFGVLLPSLFLYTMPIFALSQSVVFLGESVHAYHIYSFILIVLGIMLANNFAIKTFIKKPFFRGS